MNNTSVPQLRKADWSRTKEDVAMRLDLLKEMVDSMEPNEMNDKVCQELIVPAMRCIADFCIRTQIK